MIDVVANISTKEVIVHGVSDHESESESSTAEFMDELSLQDSLNEVEGPAVESQTVITEFKLDRPQRNYLSCRFILYALVVVKKLIIKVRTIFSARRIKIKSRS